MNEMDPVYPRCSITDANATDIKQTDKVVVKKVSATNPTNPTNPTNATVSKKADK
jgi:aspartate/methionine/tyrosine aminotransferase